MSNADLSSTEPLQAGMAWQGRAIGLLDLDAFFAAVEQLDHPEWRGKPVIVGGPSSKRGVVATASYEARSYGVQSAMPSAEAERRCPQAIWVRGRFDRYREVSDQVMSILSDETHLVEQVSVDEAFFDITPGRFSREHPLFICQRISQRVSELGITCSIGLGTSKSVAKIASEREKPRGLTVVWPGREASFLSPLGVGELSGIGPKAAEALHRVGIATLGQLAKAPEGLVKKTLGSHGATLVARAQGCDNDPVAERAAKRLPKSLSREKTFAHDLTRTSDMEAALCVLADEVATRLRKKELYATTITVKLRTSRLKIHTAQKPLLSPTCDAAMIAEAACDLLAELVRTNREVRLLGIGTSGLLPASEVTVRPLFVDGSKAHEKSEALGRLRDAMRERFGNQAACFGRDLRVSRFEEELHQ